MRHLKENLLVQFSIVSFVIMAAIVVVLVVVLSNKIRSDAIDALVDEAIGASSGRLSSAISPADLETPMTGERYDKFDKFIQQSIVSDRTARVKLWGKDGTIIYVNDPAGVGEKFPEKPNFQKAMAGENAIEIKIPDGVDNKRERFLGTLMEVYTPIMFPGSSEPDGVFEIYQYYQPTQQLIDSTRATLIGSIGIGFLVLYIGLVSIVWRGWRTINRQQVDLGTANAGLQASNNELKVTASNLERSNRELQDFASIAAHDLQEPLRKVQAFGDRLKTKYGESIDERGQDYLSRMQDAAGRMQVLINDLLTYSRVTTKAQPFTKVDLAKVSRDVISDLEVRIEQSGGRVEVGELRTIDADPTQMRQLIQNLVGNALKFQKPEEPPVVKINAHALNGHNKGADKDLSAKELCQITVQDNGIGFDEEYKDQIFTIFQRLHTREEYEGTGIGLAVCRKIVERHGGTIDADSKAGEGTTFVINLPVKQAKGEMPT